ncbi:MAG: archease [Candidatus Marsarchaeota archaeon]|nr:archease [Candidatus Marsarchaeota archaeon]
MLRYRFVAHTADVRFFSFGADFEELVKNSLLAMFDTQADIKKISKDATSGKASSKQISISESASSERDALWYILQRALSELDANGSYGYSVGEVRVLRGTGKINVSATIKCVDQSTEYSKIYVKGVSGYTLSIKKRNGRYSASIVIDI